MVVLPPGTLLQLMYLKERLRRIPSGYFIEIGPGSGEITHMLLAAGWSGASYDIEEKTILALNKRFAKEIVSHRFTPINDDFITAKGLNNKADLVISCMVMEHLEENIQESFMRTASKRLNSNGLMIGLVPASPEYWGIEDDIAGHFRRYTREQVSVLLDDTNWSLRHIAGLTFPVSNLLLPISNFLVNRAERPKLALSALDRTKDSGNRNVKFKTHFPSILALILNRYTLFPLHVLQKIFQKSRHSLVLYFEASFTPGIARND